MGITHPGQQSIFYCDIFVEFVLYVLELILFHVFICFICLIRILFIKFNKYHLSFVHFCYFVVCMCIHVYVQIIVMWIIFGGLFSLYVHMFVGINTYCISHSFKVCLHVFFLCGLNCLGVNYFTNFTFLIWTWYVCIHRKRRHGWFQKYRPLNMGSQVWKHRVTF